MIELKINALIFIGIGLISMILTKEGTFFVYSCLIGIPLFFSKEDWFK